MGKKFRSLLDRYGYYAMIFLCLGTVLFSALITRRDDDSKAASRPSLVSSDERLSDVEFTDKASETTAPVIVAPLQSAKIVRGFSTQPVYIEVLHLWRAHRAIDYAAKEDEAVFSIRAGHVTDITEHSVTVQCDDGTYFVYEGLKEVCVSVLDAIKAGGELGKAAGLVQGEENGILHVACFSAAGEALNFLEE